MQWHPVCLWMVCMRMCMWQNGPLFSQRARDKVRKNHSSLITFFFFIGHLLSSRRTIVLRSLYAHNRPTLLLSLSLFLLFYFLVVYSSVFFFSLSFCGFLFCYTYIIIFIFCDVVACLLTAFVIPTKSMWRGVTHFTSSSQTQFNAIYSQW